MLWNKLILSPLFDNVDILIWEKHGDRGMVKQQYLNCSPSFSYVLIKEFKDTVSSMCVVFPAIVPI